MNYERQSPDASAIFRPFFMTIKTEMNLFQRKLLLISINPLWRNQLVLFLMNGNET